MAGTAADSLGVYLSSSESATALNSPADCLGGVRQSEELVALAPLITPAYPQLIVQHVSGYNGEGQARIRATSTTALAYTAPGGTEGTPVAVADGESKWLADGTTASKGVRVARDGSAVWDTRPGYPGMILDLVRQYGSPIAHRNVTSAEQATGLDTYSAVYFYAHGSTDCTSLKWWLPTLGTQRTSNSTQLGASGSGTITTTGSFADWPTSGYCRVTQSGGTLREIVYYTSRTSTALTVPAAGRGLLGTSAGAGAGTDLVDAVPGIRIALEAPGSDGNIQTIANATTSPTGRTWNTSITSAAGLSLATLGAGTTYGLWIHRHVPAGATGLVGANAGILWEWVNSGVTYSGKAYGRYAIADAGAVLYEVYKGQDAAPDFTAAAAATSATLPIVHALAAPPSGTRTWHVVCRQRNAYNLVSQNRYARKFTINSSGTLVNSPLAEPESVTVTDTAGGAVQVAAVYYALRDTTPADTFNVYAKVGSDPTPGVDTPTAVLMTNSGSWVSGVKYLDTTLTGYSWGDDLRVIVTAFRSSDSEESTNTTATTLMVGTTAPPPVAWRRAFAGHTNDHAQSGRTIDTTTVINAPNNVYWRCVPGETQLWWDTGLVWRCVWPDATRAVLQIPTAYNFDTPVTSLGSGTGNVEIVAGPPKLIYLNAGGTRQVKIDATNFSIGCDSITSYGTITDCPAAGPVVALATELLLQVFDPSRGRWVAYASVSNAGVLTTACAVVQTKG